MYVDRPKLTVADVHEVFSATFPAKAATERATLEYVETVAMPDGFGIVVRLIIWDEHAGTLSIRDIKEQQVWLDPNDASRERLTEYARAFVKIASLALTHHEVETLMPHDLLISNVLGLSKPQTEDEFARALSVKSRLGKYLPAAGSPAPRLV